MTLILDLNVAINISIFFVCMITIAVSKNLFTRKKKRKKRKNHKKDKTAKRGKPTKDKKKRKK